MRVVDTPTSTMRGTAHHLVVDSPGALAWLAPGAAPLVPDLGEDPVAPSPFDGVPPLLPPGGHGGGVEDGGNPDDRPQPPALVPDSAGSPADTSTTAVVIPSGDGPGDLTGGTTGSGGGTPTGAGATPAPEPEILWLISCGVVGLASRRLRK
jgi:hypothetical protein